MHHQVGRDGEGRRGLDSFSATGADVTWAVMDSGINADHPHFKLHGNIDPASNLHADFTGTDEVPEGKIRR